MLLDILPYGKQSSALAALTIGDIIYKQEHM